MIDIFDPCFSCMEIEDDLDCENCPFFKAISDELNELLDGEDDAEEY